MVKIKVLQHIFEKADLRSRNHPYKKGFLFIAPNVQMKSFLYLNCFERNRRTSSLSYIKGFKISEETKYIIHEDSAVINN
ncbi:unnamed protein product [Eruca vesicaria subsp. sativa]|uniref:Uncharacterized protein n=1 Tax=Eruca vesicaria subsp. sativa TaxID=29727 RepID=A0ABC8K4G7_ERUVS|nr:unnamed protein product [Eruca vesicaria subsp. sativa]